MITKYSTKYLDSRGIIEVIGDWLDSTKRFFIVKLPNNIEDWHACKHIFETRELTLPRAGEIRRKKIAYLQKKIDFLNELDLS